MVGTARGLARSMAAREDQDSQNLENPSLTGLCKQASPHPSSIVTIKDICCNTAVFFREHFEESEVHEYDKESRSRRLK